MKKGISVFVFVFLVTISFANNGNLLIIGGGSEKDSENSWNHAAYSWAIGQAQNKRIAIISYYSESIWLPDYFMNQCGAVFAKNFQIGSLNVADLQSTYDSLITYDVIFFKGGDQYNYYSTYKNTKTQEAAEDVFNNGGVICGTSAGLAILSGVIFTAENGSAYPDDCLKDPNNSNVQLANDFFQFFPGYIFDSHFTIRGRFSRLLAFMANWKFTHNETIKGIGVDEMTALSIDQNNLGTVYGIGSVNLYQVFNENTFSQNNTKLIADSVKVTQLLQGCTIDFNTGIVNGLTLTRNPLIGEENGNYIVLAGGSDNLSNNTDLLNEFVNQTGSNSDKIIIITSGDQSVANNYKDQLEQDGAQDVKIYSATLDMASNTEFENQIYAANKFLFVNNSYGDLMYFLGAGSTGQALNNRIRSNGVILAFIGDNSRYIGHTVVEKYLTADAAYHGELEFNDGLNLLKSTVIIPNTYFSSDYYENTATAVPYAMITDTLTFGIWLNKDNYFKYAPTSNNETYIYGFGISPVMVIKNTGTNTGFSEQSAYGDSNDTPPQFSGFENMTLSLIDESTPYKAGNDVEITTSIESVKTKNIKVLVNNKLNQIDVSCPNDSFQMNIIDTSGRVIKKKQIFDNATVSTDTFKSGIYIINLQSKNYSVNKKVFISNQ